MNLENVIILGAGASKSEGAPLQDKLLEEFFAFYEIILKNRPKDADLVRQFTRITKYFRDVWGISPVTAKHYTEVFPTFEESIGVLDLAFLRNEAIKGYSRQEIALIRRALVFLIAKVLDETLKEKAVHHRALIRRLYVTGDLKNTAFISLNYDILIDNALQEMFDAGFDIDYGVELANYGRNYDFTRPRENKGIFLIKLHGSLNWLYCPTCSSIERTEKKATDAYYRPTPCRDCDTELEPVLIPPTYYKTMDNLFLQQLILKSFEILRSARRLYFCGYSFPDADFHVKYLLKKAELYSGDTPEIFVINKNKNEVEEKRYFRFFRKKARVQYLEMDFETFGREGLVH